MSAYLAFPALPVTGRDQLPLGEVIDQRFYRFDNLLRVALVL